MTPKLQSAQYENSAWTLRWTAGGAEAPSGGYDIWIDGRDTASLYRTNQLTATVKGLRNARHCFKIEARYLQANPVQFPHSSEICTDPLTVAAPVLESVQNVNNNWVLQWSQPESIPSGGYDIFIDGVDTAAAYRTARLATTIPGEIGGSQPCFQVEARWLQAVPTQFQRSNEVCAGASVQPPPSSETSPSPPVISGPVAAFPGAKGFGTSTKAGRGGQIIRVTNLNDSGAGSLRAAVEASGPRTIVFEVSGRINLLSNLTLRNPYVTIAGQTAPAPGIMVTGRTFSITTNDVLVQHVAFRLGDEDKADNSGRTADAIQITGSGAYNIVLDHVSASWGIDEIVGIGYGIKDITFSNCLFAEGLNNSVHPKGPHGYGMLLADGSTRLSLIGNLLAHAAERLPRIAGASVLLANNVFYNKGGTDFSGVGSGDAKLPSYISAVGNLFLDGPSGSAGKAITEVSSQIQAGSAIYQKDNSYPGGTVFSGRYGAASPPGNTWIAGFSYERDVNLVKSAVMKNAGARPAARDAVDKRVMADLANRTGRLIDSQRDVGGFPVLAQNRAAFNAGQNPNGDDNGNGYTNLEEILYQMALQVEGR